MSVRLSQVRGWDTEHLVSAGRHWSATANRWEDAFSQLELATHMPGGTQWEGAAARAAQDRAHADRRRVSALAGQMHTASTVAKKAAGEIQAAQHRILSVVAAAKAAGFTVGEDFSLTADVTDAREGANVEARMRELGSELRHCVEQLIDLDQQVAERIRRTTDGIGNLTFTETNDAVRDHNGAIQAIDNRVLKVAPQPAPPDPTPGPLPPVNDAEDVKRVLDPLQNGGRRGSNGVGSAGEVKEIWDEPSTRRLWEYLTRNAIDHTGSLEYKGVVRALPDGTKIGFRASEGWGDTIDVWYPNDYDDIKTHTPYEPYFPPLISGPPQFPPATETPSVQVIPQQLMHPPSALPPPGIFEPNGLPPWLQNPSAPAFHAPVQPPTIMPGIALPGPHTADPVRDDGSELDVMGGAVVDAGRAVGSAIIGGIVAVGGLLGTVANPAREVVP